MTDIPFMGDTGIAWRFIGGSLCLAGMFAGAVLEQLVVNKPHVPITGFLVGWLAGFMAALVLIVKVWPGKSPG